MPQWDFLKFCAEQAKRYPTFRLLMETEATDLVYEGGHVAGILARTKHGPLEIRAGLVVGADGRSSTLRERAGLEVVDTGAPIDVLWMRLSKHGGDPAETFGNVGAGGLLVTIDRREYFQCALVIKKGGFDEIRAAGLDALRARVASLAPFLADRVDELRTWDDVKLLTVKIDHLRRWYRAGLLCIGDAAHAMSPVGGVGVNLAIQDGVATANLLADTLLHGAPSERQLAAVQRRRAFPARLIQTGQIAIQERSSSTASGVKDGRPSAGHPQFIQDHPMVAIHSRLHRRHRFSSRKDKETRAVSSRLVIGAQRGWTAWNQ